MSFKEGQKWIVTLGGASEEGWPWLEVGDVLTVNKTYSDTFYDADLFDNNGELKARVHYVEDVVNNEYLVPFIVAD